MPLYMSQFAYTQEAWAAFFEEDATQWGYFVGLPVFAVGLIWLGYALRSGREESAARASRVR